jgi:hypothetical protein
MHGRHFVLLALMAAGCSHSVPLQPTPAPASVDVLDFLIGSASSWPRRGSQSQNQFVDMNAREICWVKYANARTFECWRWDDEYVYHVVDHAIDGNTGESYRFSDGRWMPRHLSGTWTLDVRANEITWFDPRCRVEARSGAFPYRQRAWIESHQDAGPDLGVRETLVLEYQPYDPAGPAGDLERFFFGRDVGWYAWERSGHQSLFNRLGGPAATPMRELICSP